MSDICQNSDEANLNDNNCNQSDNYIDFLDNTDDAFESKDMIFKISHNLNEIFVPISKIGKLSYSNQSFDLVMCNKNWLKASLESTKSDQSWYSQRVPLFYTFWLLNAWAIILWFPDSFQHWLWIFRDSHCNFEDLWLFWYFLITNVRDIFIAKLYLGIYTDSYVVFIVWITYNMLYGGLTVKFQQKFYYYMGSQINKDNFIYIIFYPIVLHAWPLVLWWKTEFTIHTFVIWNSDTILIMLNMILIVYIAWNYIKRNRDTYALQYVIRISLKASFTWNYFTLLFSTDTTFEHNLIRFIKIFWINFTLATVLILQNKYGSRFFLPKKWRRLKHDYVKKLTDLYTLVDIDNGNVSDCEYWCSSLLAPGLYTECSYSSEFDKNKHKKGLVAITRWNHMFHYSCLYHHLQNNSTWVVWEATGLVKFNEFDD